MLEQDSRHELCAPERWLAPCRIKTILDDEAIDNPLNSPRIAAGSLGENLCHSVIDQLGGARFFSVGAYQRCELVLLCGRHSVSNLNDLLQVGAPFMSLTASRN